MNIDRTLILSLFGTYTLKLLALGASPADAAVVLVLAGAHFAYSSQIQNKEISQLKQELIELKNTLADQNITISEIKTTIVGVKLKENMKVINR